MRKETIEAYGLAKRKYAEYGVDTEERIGKFLSRVVSLHCWQGDDVRGFEGYDGQSQNVVTGSCPGRARDASELRRDMAEALSLSPGTHKVALQASYAEEITSDRDAYTPSNFSGWIGWAKELGIGLDFNSTFFAHRMVKDGLTLTCPDLGVRQFWIRHAQACRRIARFIGESLGRRCVHNLWIPDGMKDTPEDKAKYRTLLEDSLNRIFEEKSDIRFSCDCLEGKLFGIGTESFVPGSYDFYLAYAAKHGIGVTLDTGHFHPTEDVSDKLSAIAPFVDPILLHLSRGVRWDSDHVPVWNDELRRAAAETVRNEGKTTIEIGLDFFDASINRVAAMTIGLRSVKFALLEAYLRPDVAQRAEEQGDFTSRFLLQQEFTALPVAAVWEYVLEKQGIPQGEEYRKELSRYAGEEQRARG